MSVLTNTFNLFLLYILQLRHLLFSLLGTVFIILTTGGIGFISSPSSRSVEIIFSSNHIYLVKFLVTQAYPLISYGISILRQIKFNISPQAYAMIPHSLTHYLFEYQESMILRCTEVVISWLLISVQDIKIEVLHTIRETEPLSRFSFWIFSVSCKNFSYSIGGALAYSRVTNTSLSMAIYLLIRINLSHQCILRQLYLPCFTFP